MSETTKLIITTSVPIFLAIIGYLGTYIYNLKLAQRKEKLERINHQLSELYGPMFGTTRASSIAWKKFKEKYRFGKEFFGNSKRLSTKEFTAWKLWMTTVFMPMNKHLFDLILAKSDLLIETEMPESMQLYCAHIAAYQAVLERWTNKDFSEIQSVVHYPEDINTYAEVSFKMLKAEQDQLLGKVRGNL